jgi:hypothetical protein
MCVNLLSGGTELVLLFFSFRVLSVLGAGCFKIFGYCEALEANPSLLSTENGAELTERFQCTV